MKTFKTSLLTIATLLCSITASAHDFEVDGIYYNVTSETDLTVEERIKYSEDVTIPTNATYSAISSTRTIGSEYDFEADGIFYNITSETDLTVEVTNDRGWTDPFGSYSGNVVIPARVIYNGIPFSVTSIKSSAFSACGSLTSITIPNSVTSIGDDAFSGCSGLTSICIEEGNLSYDSRNNCNAIVETNSNTLIKGCQTTVIPNSVTSIGNDAFSGCSGLTSITIPHSVTNIEEYAFSGCSGLTSITIPHSVTNIEEYAFSSCSGLTSICVEEGNPSYDSRNNCNAIIETNSSTLITGCQTTVIPNSVTSIRNNAFRGCSSLTSITIPNSVMSIGDEAFYGCSSFTSITIPNSVTSIGEKAFYGCYSLADITILGDSMMDISPKYFESTAWMGNQPDGLLYLGNYLLGYKGNIQGAYTIKEGTKTIVNGALESCSELTGITIPNSVINIGEDAFYDCDGLIGIHIPNSVTSIGETAFGSCSNFRIIRVEEGNPSYDSRDNCNAIIETNSNMLITGCQTTVIPNSVTSIGDKAFRYCSGLTSISIPNSVTSIGRYAFSSCSGLTCITIPNSVTNIGYRAFSSCSGLMNISIPNSVTSIGEEAFAFCSSLTNITIPNSVTNIGSSAFYGCSGLTSISIPNSVTNIGEYAFSYCPSFRTIRVEEGNPNYDSRDNCNAIIETSSDKLILGCQTTVIPNSVASIGYGAFSGCSSLKNITIPNSVASIGYGAFYDCSGLKNITIPNSVTSIGEWAFANCENLTQIACYAVEPPICADDVFYVFIFDEIYGTVEELQVPKGCILKVPVGSKDAYQAAEGWKNFQIIEDVLDGIEDVLTDEPALPKFVDVYTLQGVKIREQIPVESLENELPRGIYIVNGKKVMVR